MKKKLLAVATVAVVAFGTPQFSNIAQAEDIQDIKEQRSSIKKDLTKAEKEVADILIDLKEIEKEIERVEESRKQNEKMMNETEADIKKTEEEAEKLQAEIDELEKQIEIRFEILKERVSSYQKSGGAVSYLEVIFGSKGFGDFISRVSAVSKIADSDANLIEQQEADKKAIEEKQQTLLDKLDELKAMKAELEEMQQLIEDQKQQNEARKEELKSKENELNNKIKELKLKDGQLASIEQSILQPLAISSSNGNSGSSSSVSSAPASSGILAWPTSGGYISSHMGLRWNRQHKGIDIARTDRSTVPPIFAAADGVVESAGWNSGGYGNRIVIRHSNGLKTTYSHLSSISVKAGQTVKKGSKIGMMGATGDSTGIHLHFEVYQNGALQNPANYY